MHRLQKIKPEDYLKTPFGLCNAPAVFQRYINEVFRDLMKKGIVMSYMDDLIVPSNDVKDGLEKLKIVLRTAEENGLEIKWKKCQFLKDNVTYLGHEIENGTVRPSRKKIEAVADFPEPTTLKKVQSFLGLTGYFRKYIKDYSLIAKPLTDLLKNPREFRFDDEQRISFGMLKDKLSSEPVLKIFNHEHQTELHVDASQDGFGGVLLQKDTEDGELVLAECYSKKIRKMVSYTQFIIGVRKPTMPKESTIAMNSKYWQWLKL
ncbi:Reverse transcriptase (RNA-dependent DNA polymerase) [Popillia japonica]|uniref:Reverse transcriptase (RNA-dependent DNA polymerase) n=1 Tax=Popillia japonica TaxID=7064 RepID=A0AAW1JWU7_POPJA